MPPTESELIDRARALAPVLAERAATCEDMSRLPDATVADFVAAGFYDISKPVDFGGFGYSPEVLFSVAMELAQGCPSSAWCLCLISVHNWEPGLMDRQAAVDLWSADPTTRFSSSYAPSGQITPVDGGFRLSGHWEWSSGSNHCSWVMLGGLLRKPDGPPEQFGMLVPQPDYEIIEHWDVAGLKGTGSHDIVVRDAFIPMHRTHSLNAPSAGQFDGSIYQLPFGNVFALCLCSVTQGIAEGALASFTDYLRERLNKYDGKAMAADPFQQRVLAEVTAAVRSNRVRFHQVFRRMEAAQAEHQLVPDDVQASEMWETQLIAHSNADLVTRLMRSSGGGAQRLDHPMQRYFRDINAGVAHAFLNVDRGSLQFAQVTLS